MIFRYLGTSAAEGIPALFCTCQNCVRSRKIGGRALRSRSQAIIDNRLLIDFPADGYMHIQQSGIDLSRVKHCLITHAHADHLYPTDITMLDEGLAHMPEGYLMTFYGSDAVGRAVRGPLEEVKANGGQGTFREVKAFEPFSAGDYTVTPLPALHDPHAGPLFYDITDGKKRILYAHDTHYFHEDVWAWFEKTGVRYDFVSLDCCNACLPLTYVGHMGLAENVRARDRMVSIGAADGNTKFICNHFSHNGISVVYDDFVPIAAKEGFGVSYDGMELEI